MKVSPAKLKKALGYRKQKLICEHLVKGRVINKSQVSRWISGAEPVPQKYIRRLARILDKSVTDICTMTKEEKENAK